jgi:tetratricopeptide (TPR) repeat protein
MIRSAKALFLVVLMGSLCFAQAPPETTNASDNGRAGAYYNFAMGRLYAELAGAYGNRNDYVSKAIQHYQDALKADPSAGIIFEELTDLYIQTNRLRDAVTQAEDLLKQNPDNLDARRMLGRIYTRMAGDSQAGKVNEDYLKLAIEQYQKVTAKDAKDAESWVVLGRLYRFANNSVDAEKAYNEAIKAEPGNEDALTGLALLYSDVGDTRRAIEKLKAVTDKNPSERTLALLARAYRELRDYKSAADALQKAVALAPDDTRLIAELADNLFLCNQLDEALHLYQQLAADDPQNPMLPLRISEIYRVKRDFAKARESLAKAKTLDPDSLDVRIDEINLLETEGKTNEAIASLKGLLDETVRKSYSAADAANRATLLDRLGVFYRGAGQYAQAVETFRQIAPLEAQSAPRAEVQIIETYRAAKDFESARKESDAALKKYPNEHLVQLTHASLLGDMGKIDEAAAEIRGLMKSQDDREMQLELAQIYEKGKRWADMAPLLDQAEKLSMSDDDKAGVHFMRGAMYERMKKFDGAEAEFRKVLELDSDNAGAMNYLGYMLADRDVRLDEASQLIKKALDLDPQNGAYLDSLGWVYYRQGKLSEAEGLLVQALDHIGQDATVHDHLGDVYFKLGKTKDAIAQWQASLKVFQAGAQSESDPEEIASVGKKIEGARVRLAKETKQK